MDVNLAATMSFHKIKWIYLEREDVSLPIVTQNENGPCPLIAIVNALSLSRRLRLEPGEQSISGQRLIEVLFSYILERKPKDLTEAQLLNYERNVQDATIVFPQLLTGLDMNVKMGSVDAFEYTREMIIFDLVDINLYHGWLVEPNSVAHSDTLATLSYNLMVEKAILGSERLPEDATEEQRQEWEENVAIGNAASTFLQQSATQLTHHGLVELQNVLKDGETCVFFRNNHFSTLYKNSGRLYVLVTDQGYFDEHQVIFESLEAVDGTSVFYDHNLVEVTDALKSRLTDLAGPAAAATATATAGATTTDGLAKTQEARDYLLALTLRQEEQTGAGGSSAGTSMAAVDATMPALVPAPTATGIPPAEIPVERAMAISTPVQESGDPVCTMVPPSTEIEQAKSETPEPMDESGLIPIAVPLQQQMPVEAQGAAPSAGDGASSNPPPFLTLDQMSSALASAKAAVDGSTVATPAVKTQLSTEELDMQMARQLQMEMDQVAALEVRDREEAQRLQGIDQQAQQQQQQQQQQQGQGQQQGQQQQQQQGQQGRGQTGDGRQQSDCTIL